MNVFQTPRGGFLAAAGLSLRILLIIGAFGFLFLSYRYGIDRQHDRTITNSHGQFWDAVCSALSVEKYGTGRYVCAMPAQKAMVAAGLFYDDPTLARIGKTLPELLSDTDFVNKGLSKIFSARDMTRGVGAINRSIGWGGDAGYADFVDLSFAIFGHNVEALYSTYFLLLALSTSVFCILFSGKSFPLFVVFSFHCTLFTFMNLGYLQDWGVVSVTNPRFVTTLTIVPVLHLVFLMSLRTLPSQPAVWLFLPQAALMVFAGHVRTTAYWAVIATVVFYSVLAGFILWRRYGRRIDWLAECWPGLTVVGCLLAGVALVELTADTRLAGMGGMRHHSFWSATYYTLQHHPDWQKKYAAKHRGTSGDGPFMVAVDEYQKRHFDKRDYLYENKSFGLSQAGLDRILRRAYVDFVLNDPWYVVEVVVYYNGATVWSLVRAVMRDIWSALDWRFLGAAAFAVLVLAAEIRKGMESLRNMALCTGMLIGFAVMSAGPNWAMLVIIDSMSDPALMGSLAAIVAAFFLAVACLVSADRLVRSRLMSASSVKSA